MTIPIKFDGRYVINQDSVNRMRTLRANGMTYKAISKKFKCCQHTVYYWCNDNYRAKKQAKNAKRRRTDPLEKQQYIKQRVKKRREIWKKYPMEYIRDAVINARNEKRSKRHKVFGKSFKEWDEILKDYNKGGIKIK